MKPRIVFFGTPEFVVPIMKSLNEHFNLVGIVTAPPTIQGRKKESTWSPVLLEFTELDIEGQMYYPEVFDDSIIESLISLQPDLFVVAAYGKIIPESVLSIPTHGSINVHPSLLPKYRGTSPIQTALKNGDDVTGVTVIKMDAKMDHGPIIAQWEHEILATDTFKSLHETLFQQTAKKLPSIIDEYIAGALTALPQNDAEATFCKKITREDGYFSLDDPPSPIQLDRMIRAYYPWPTAWTKVRIKNNEERIMKFLPDNLIQLEGGKPMKLKDIVNGYPEIRQTLRLLLGDKNSNS